MKRFTSIFTSLALATPLVLGAGIASAQSYRGERRHEHEYPQQTYPQQTHPAPVYPAPAYPAPVYPQAQPQPLPLPVAIQSRPRLVEKTGIVQSFLFSGRRVRGVMLTDGSTVLLRSANRSLTRRVAPGSLIRVRGFVMPGNPSTIRNATLIAIRMRAANPPTVTVTPIPAPAPAPVFTQAPAVIRSSIASIQWGANGPRALVLRNGNTVHLTGAMSRALAQRGVRVGERIVVTAHASSPVAGAALLADTLQFSDGTLHANGR